MIEYFIITFFFFTLNFFPPVFMALEIFPCHKSHYFFPLSFNVHLIWNSFATKWGTNFHFFFSNGDLTSLEWLKPIWIIFPFPIDLYSQLNDSDEIECSVASTANMDQRKYLIGLVWEVNELTYVKPRWPPLPWQVKYHVSVSYHLSLSWSIYIINFRITVETSRNYL